MKTLTEVIEGFSDVRLLVVGDFLLDQFVFGRISRVSREAPVLILSYQETLSVPGGGGNTVANAASLGARVTALGFVGRDKTADTLVGLWPREVDHEHVFRDPQWRTTRKVRLLAGSFHSFRQQVVRLDYEFPGHLDEAREQQMLASLDRLLPEVDALIVSDYSLGNLTPSLRSALVQRARRSGHPLVVDSRDHPEAYPGATSITPNISEIARFFNGREEGREGLEQAGERLRSQWQLEALLVTRGKLGMSLFADGSVLHIPVYGTDEVVDVTGAGDTVVATYATALAAGSSFEQAARLANYAGGLVVLKRGTATLTARELLEAVRNDSTDS